MSEVRPITPPVMIAGWRFDPVAQTLVNGERSCNLGYRAAQVLWRLHTEAGKPVSRAELIAFAWPGQLPTDVALSQVIVELRRALGDAARSPRHLVTVPRVGYRLVVDDSAVSQAADSTGSSSRRARVAVALLLLSIVAAGAWLLRSRPAEESSSSQIASLPVPVVFSGAMERMPDLSRDGRDLVYAVNREGFIELHALRLDGSEPRQLTRGAHDTWPRFSRDGRIAFLRVDGTVDHVELRVVDRIGDESRVLAVGAFEGSIDWRPDSGAVVAGVRDADGNVRPQSIDIRSGHMQPLFDAPWAPGEGWVKEPSYSPSGQRLLLRVGNYPRSRLLLIDLQSGERRYVSDESRLVFSHAWRDERHLLLSAQARGRFGLWQVDLDDGEWHYLRTEPLSRITVGGGRLVFPRAESPVNLMRFSLADGTTERVGRNAFDSYAPRFLGATDAIVFLSTRSGSEQFWRLGGDAPEQRLGLLKDSTVLGYDVSADGRRLVYSLGADDGVSMHVVETADAKPRRIDRGDFLDLGSVALMTGSNEVLCIGRHASAGNGLFGLWPDGRVQLRAAGEDFEEVQASPGGEVFVTRRGEPGYYRVEDGQVRLQPGMPLQALPGWRVVGDGIVVHERHGDDQPDQVRLYPFDGGEPRTLGDWPAQLRASAFDIRDGEVIGSTVDSLDVNLMSWDLPPLAD